MQPEDVTFTKVKASGRRIVAGLGLFVGLGVLLWLGLVAFESRSLPPDSAPESGAPLHSNTLVLTEERVRNLGLAAREAVEINGVIFVAAEALQEVPNGFYLWLEDFDLKNAFVKTRVIPGARTNGNVEIVNGILPGDKVIVSGASKLRFECDNVKRSPVQTRCDMPMDVKTHTSPANPP